MKTKEYIYYWYCPACKVDKQPAESLAHALELLKGHEGEKHKGKMVGTFGKANK